MASSGMGLLTSGSDDCKEWPPTTTTTATTTTTITTTRSYLDLAGDLTWNANLRSLLLAARHTGTIGVLILCLVLMGLLVRMSMRLRLVVNSCTWESKSPKYTTLGWLLGKERREERKWAAFW